MATPPASDEQIDGPDDGPEATTSGTGPFDALTDDLNDLRIRHQHCWLWPQITLEIDRLDDVLVQGRLLLEPLTTERPDWAMKACAGIARSNPAIHQQVERYDSYAQAARSLWTTFIPDAPPTLTDAQIYAVMAMYEARLAAEAYCEIAAGIEEEMTQAGVGHGDEDEIVDLRCDIAGWERWHWHYAAQQVGTAERFLLMAEFAASTPDSSVIKKAEAQIAKLQRRARKAEAAAEPFHGGRRPGAVNRLTKALKVLVERVGSRNIDDVLPEIQDACADLPIEGIQFQDYNDIYIWYLDVVSQSESKIKITSLKRALGRLQDN
jgi:hypothetical protein